METHLSSKRSWLIIATFVMFVAETLVINLPQLRFQPAFLFVRGAVPLFLAIGLLASLIRTDLIRGLGRPIGWFGILLFTLSAITTQIPSEDYLLGYPYDGRESAIHYVTATEIIFRLLLCVSLAIYSSWCFWRLGSADSRRGDEQPEKSPANHSNTSTGPHRTFYILSLTLSSAGAAAVLNADPVHFDPVNPWTRVIVPLALLAGLVGSILQSRPLRSIGWLGILAFAWMAVSIPFPSDEYIVGPPGGPYFDEPRIPREFEIVIRIVSLLTLATLLSVCFWKLRSGKRSSGRDADSSSAKSK